MEKIGKIVIGVDPHKLSAAIEVVDHRERVLVAGRFATDKAGYAAMRKHVASWPERTWAVEGSNGAGRPLAQRLLADGESVVDAPAKLAARVRVFDTGNARKTDATMPTRLRRQHYARRPCGCSARRGPGGPAAAGRSARRAVGSTGADREPVAPAAGRADPRWRREGPDR